MTTLAVPPDEVTAAWSVNRLAARAVAVHAGGTPADRLELLEALGLIAGDDRREILPDDTRPNVMVDLGKAPGTKDPDALNPRAFAEHGRRPEGMTTPPGLRDLPPLPVAPVRRPRRPAKGAARPAPSTTPPGGRKRPIPHGKTAGYFAHSRRKEPIPADDACGCRAAGNAYFRARRDQQQAS